MTTITITSKGQVTLPANVRRTLKLKEGDKLQVDVNQKSRSINLRKPIALDDLTQKAQSYIKVGTKPVLDADAYYQKHREVT